MKSAYRFQKFTIVLHEEELVALNKFLASADMSDHPRVRFIAHALKQTQELKTHGLIRIKKKSSRKVKDENVSSGALPKGHGL